MKKKTKKVNNKKEDGSIIFYSEEIKKSKSINEDTVKFITFTIISIIVLGLLFLLFFLNGKYVTKDKYQGDTTTTTTEPAYDDTQTIVSTMYNIGEDTYYVLAYDKSDDINSDYYKNLALGFHNEKIKLYTLDLNNAMNNRFYNTDKEQVFKDKNNTNFTTNTLLVLKKGKVTQVITDRDAMSNLLNKKDSAK